MEWHKSFPDGQLETHRKLALEDRLPIQQAQALIALSNEPLLEMRFNFYWTAYEELATDRPVTMNGAGLIPLTAIRAYSDDFQMSRIERDMFKAIMMSVDRHMHNFEAAKQKKK